MVAKSKEIDGSPTVDDDLLEMDLQSVALVAEASGDTALRSALSSHVSSTSRSERVS
jgi:hypothetical protein